jgi:hypothetical protein
MQPITVFYHLYLPPEHQYYLFPIWLDEQLGALKRSKLSAHARIKMCITMPIYFQVLNMNKNYYDLVSDYIKTRYPFVDIIDVRDTGMPNIYEGQTLYHVWQHAQNNEGTVLYYHSKGITTPGNPAVHDWRKMMQHFLIDKWELCKAYLESNDLVTTKSQWLGNFWWATCNHLRTLPNPINSNEYVTHDPNMMPGLSTYRLAFEIWCLYNKPRVHYAHATTVDHYQMFYPPEAYTT